MSDSNALRELLAVFRIDVDAEDLEKGEKLIEGFKETLTGFGEMVAEAFAVHEVKEFISSQIEAGAALGHTTEMLGVTVGEFEAFAFAVKSAGGSAESASGALRFLSRNMAAAASGSGEQAEAFTSMGIAIKDGSGQMRPAIDVMADLADKMKATDDPTKKVGISMKLLGRAGAQMIPALNQGGEAFRKAREEVDELGGNLGEEFVRNAKLAEEGLVKVDTATTGLKREIMMELFPGVLKIIGVMKDLTGWLVQTEKKSHLFSDALDFLKAGAIVGGILKIVSALNAMTKAEALALITNPFVLWVVGIGLVLLAYNDLKVALEGGKSVFGDLFGQTGIKELREDLDGLVGAFDLVKAAAQEVLSGLEIMGNSIQFIGNKVGWLLAKAHELNSSGTESEGWRRSAQQYSDAADADVDKMHQHKDESDAGWDKARKSVRARAGIPELENFNDERAQGRLSSDNSEFPLKSTPHPYGGNDSWSPPGSFNATAPPMLMGGPNSTSSSSASSTTINQNNPVTVTVQTNNPQAVVKPIKSAVATANQIDMTNGKTTRARP
jgi:hypothetical protein